MDKQTQQMESAAMTIYMDRDGREFLKSTANKTERSTSQLVRMLVRWARINPQLFMEEVVKNEITR